MARTVLPLRSVSEGEEELVHEEHQVQDLDNVVDDGRGVVSKRPAFFVVRWTRCPDNIQDDRGGEPVRCFNH